MNKDHYNSLCEERWPRGRRRTPGERIASNRRSWVQIPFSPPEGEEGGIFPLFYFIMKTAEILKKYNIFLKKSLGQNYLTSTNIPKKIVNFTEIDKSFVCIEIGTGLGILTSEISKRAKIVFSYEIDKRLIQVHKDLIKENNVIIKYENFLKADLNIYRGEKIAYVANIPYNITSPILEKIFFDSPKFEFIVLMVQREFAQRMNASMSTKEYGAMTVNLNTQADFIKGFDVKSSEFIPKPKVDSSVIKILPNYKIKKSDFKEFRKFVNLCFSQRRKKLKNNLKNISENPLELLKTVSIDENARAEQLSIKEFINLFYAYKKYKEITS